MFNISEFKSRMDKHGGPGRTSLFEVSISPTTRTGNIIVPGIISSDDLRFFCQTVSVPGINLEVMPYASGGFGATESMPMNSTLDQLNCVFMLDSDHRVMTYFHRWISSVVNVSGGRGGSSKGLERKLIDYKENYAASELTIRHYSTHNPSQYYESRYEGVFPTEIGGINLSWDATNAISTMTVNFSYNRMTYSGFLDSNADTSGLFVGSQYSVVRGNTIAQTIQNFNERTVNDLTTIPLT